MTPSGGRPAADDDDPCIVPGCSERALRHLALVEARKAFDQLPETGRSAPLCRTHYKEWKKATKDDRMYDRMGR